MLRSDIAAARETFENGPTLDKERTERKSRLASTIAELTAKLEAAKADLATIEKLGSARDQYIASVIGFEGRGMSLATGL
jgi:hypothetical protein